MLGPDPVHSGERGQQQEGGGEEDRPHNHFLPNWFVVLSRSDADCAIPLALLRPMTALAFVNLPYVGVAHDIVTNRRGLFTTYKYYTLPIFPPRGAAVIGGL